MIKIQEPRSPWQLVHVDWVVGLPPGGYESYNFCLVSFDRFSKTPIFFSCHKDDTTMDTALLVWNKVLSWAGIFTNIIGDRDTKFTSELWKHLKKLFGTKLFFSTAYKPQAEGLAEEMVRRIDAYGLQLKDCDSLNKIGVPF
ncbi:hypothetical protein O181_038314 [Austropuccinia psidii MF-1]|uniref:Integrase catalytic domain-containing protein n=1 Tax=Austropuccinia psidii MF-1 TaxID=1389203 RepID=A0A9Q3D882_9BASI|nr:hypothetical protein [Austropuccinia psidii MF-1]